MLAVYEVMVALAPERFFDEEADLPLLGTPEGGIVSELDLLEHD